MGLSLLHLHFTDTECSSSACCLSGTLASAVCRKLEVVLRGCGAFHHRAPPAPNRWRSTQVQKWWYARRWPVHSERGWHEVGGRMSKLRRHARPETSENRKMCRFGTTAAEFGAVSVYLFCEVNPDAGVYLREASPLPSPFLGVWCECI